MNNGLGEGRYSGEGVSFGGISIGENCFYGGILGGGG
jgi:hypothetical protein